MTKENTPVFGAYNKDNDQEGYMNLGTGDFTVELYLPKGGGFDTGKAAPDDGQWHTVAIQRGPCKTRVYGDEYIYGMMFRFVKTYGEDGKLEGAQYTRADLVRG